MRVKLGCVSALAALVLVSGCDSRHAPPKPGPTQLLGMWGGNGIRLTAEREGAELLYDCAVGGIEGPIVVDEEGRFDVEGTFVPTPGPEPEGGRETHPALHSGRVAGGTMVLTMTLTKTGEGIGRFELRLGDEGRIQYCR